MQIRMQMQRQIYLYSPVYKSAAACCQEAQMLRVDEVLRLLSLDSIAEGEVGWAAAERAAGGRAAAAGGLSAGERVKLALALKMLRMPAVLLLQHPTSGLDAAASRDVMRTLRRLLCCLLHPYFILYERALQAERSLTARSVARAVLSIARTLRRLCDRGHSTVVTIHRPCAETFASFDEVLLLDRGSLALLCSPAQVS